MYLSLPTLHMHRCHLLGTSGHLNGVDPRLDCDEGLLLADVVHEDHALGSAVVGLGHRLEPLLASRVPELQGDDPVIHLQSLAVEINT